jgi:hypothetical protein
LKVPEVFDVYFFQEALVTSFRLRTLYIWEESTTLQSSLLKGWAGFAIPAAAVGNQMMQDGTPTGRLSHCGDLVGLAPKEANVLFDPVQSNNLNPKPAL